MPPARFPDLVGTWRGDAETSEWGHVHANLFVNDQGWASVTLAVKGHVLSEQFRIDAWDGARLTASARGESLAVPAAHRGPDALVADLPEVGQVVFARAR